MEQLVEFISNHWSLWLALIFILLLIFANEFVRQKKRAKELSPSEAVLKINDENAVVVDLREKDTYHAGHITGAIHGTMEEFDQNRMDKYKSRPLILVCARGLQAPSLAAKLRTKGFEQPIVLAGGMAAWHAANMPTVKR